MSLKKILGSLGLLLISSVVFAGPKVGLIQLVEHPSLDEIRGAIVSTLEKNLGDVTVDYQNGQNNPSLINSICQKFVGDKVDVIVAIATPAAQGAAAATEDIPVVFAAVTDPVAAGLVKDPNKPEGNVTGTSDLINVEGIFNLAFEMTPEVKRFGMIHNPAEVNSQVVIDQATELLKSKGCEVVDVPVSSSAEVASAMNSMSGKVDAVFVPIDNTVASAMTLLSDIAIKMHLPVYTAADSLVHDGGLATVGVNYTKLGEETGDMVTQVLKGTAVADLPVRHMKDFSRVVNQETAKALGLDVAKFVSQ